MFNKHCSGIITYCPLYINFIDFKKAFDSIHHDTLWKILRSYGVPLKIVSLIETFYNQFECSDILSNTSSELFPIKSGIRQGCILSLILFLVVVEWVMRKPTSYKPRDIQWTLFSQLEDLDFADDLAFLLVKLDHLQEKTDRLERYSKQTINTPKTQVMSLNTTPTAPVTVNGEPLKFVQDFTYLGSLISKDNGGQKHIKAILSIARCAFAKLQNIWKSNQYTTKINIRLYNSNVKSILLYGSECW